MPRALLLSSGILLTVCLTGCSSSDSLSHAKNVFVQESDKFFDGGKKTVVKPDGEDQEWVLYYFETDTLETICSRLVASGFYKNESWGALRPDKGIVGFTSGRRGVPRGELSLIALTPGRLSANLVDTESQVGASVLLVPSSRSGKAGE